MIYLGTPGRMVGISCPAEQRLNTADRFSFQTTLEGRVKAQVRPGGRRTWDLRLPRTSTPSEVAALDAFANGSWGPGPFWFVSADAPHTNLLSPGASQSVSMLNGGGSLGGPWDTEWGLAARSLLNTEAAFLYWDTSVPVQAGKPVTGSAVLQGEGHLRLWWRNGAGESSVTGSDSFSSPSGPVQVSVTAQPPSWAEFVTLGVSREVTRAALPAVTWTETVMPWVSGQGCEKAVVRGMSSDLVLAIPGRTFGGAEFTVQEVG